jgi:hypothetical protein
VASLYKDAKLPIMRIHQGRAAGSADTLHLVYPPAIGNTWPIKPFTTASRAGSPAMPQAVMSVLEAALMKACGTTVAQIDTWPSPLTRGCFHQTSVNDAPRFAARAFGPATSGAACPCSPLM